MNSLCTLNLTAHRLPVLPTTRARHLALSNLPTPLPVVQSDLDRASITPRGNPRFERRRAFVAKVDASDFDKVALADAVHVHAAALILADFGADAAREGDELSFLTDVGVHVLQLRCAVLGHDELWNRAVGVVHELFDGDGAPEAAAAGEGTVVVEEVVVALELDVARVVREGAGLALHDDATVGPGTSWRWSGRVSDIFVAAVGSVEDVVELISLVDPVIVLASLAWDRLAGLLSMLTMGLLRRKMVCQNRSHDEGRMS